MHLPDADVLLVVPPVAHLTWPALGVHQLQACARAEGFEVAVLYLNALYAARIGKVAYAGLGNAPVHWLIGERLFARAAWGAPALGFASAGFTDEVRTKNASVGKVATRYLDHLSDASGAHVEGGDYRYPLDDLRHWEAEATALIDDVASEIRARRYRVVGATTTFDQTSAALALLDRVHAPGTTTVLGGANCEGAMADGIRSLGARVDHVFSGESDHTFVRFLHDGGAPVIRGGPVTDLDALPDPDFSEYFDQVRPVLGDTPTWVLYETSRGCWWGAKHHCTFCGLNGEAMGHRAKSPDRVIAQLGALSGRVFLTDNILPHAYHRTVVPRIAGEAPGLNLFYETKANLTLAQVQGLYDAGCHTIQPGIEALDSDLLRRMRKGVLARQNIALLRYARSVGMRLKWALLWGFPGDDAQSYRRTEALLPLLTHLQPPQALAHLHLDRFSPYVEHPGEHGVSGLRPLPAYGEVFPDSADLDALAYHFFGAYDSGSDGDGPLMRRLHGQIEGWKALWDRPRLPLLHVRALGDGYQLMDTRDGATTFALTEAMAHAVLVGGPWAKVPGAGWAVRNRFAVQLDGWCVPLATATPALLAEMEQTEAPPVELVTVR